MSIYEEKVSLLKKLKKRFPKPKSIYGTKTKKVVYTKTLKKKRKRIVKRSSLFSRDPW